MWLPLYFLEYLHYSKVQAGLYSTVIDIGGVLGSPLIGILLDYTCPEAPFLGITVILVIGTISMALFCLTAHISFVLNAIFLFIAGAANCGPDSILSGSISMDIGERGQQGKGGGVTSIVNGVGNVGGMVEGPLIGYVLGIVGWSGVLYGLTGLSAMAAVATGHALVVDRRLRKDTNENV